MITADDFAGQLVRDVTVQQIDITEGDYDIDFSKNGELYARVKGCSGTGYEVCEQLEFPGSSRFRTMLLSEVIAGVNMILARRLP